MPLHSMNFFSSFFTNNEVQENEEEELIEKTKNPRLILIDLNTLYKPNQSLATKKISLQIQCSLDVSWSSISLGLKNFFYSDMEQDVQETLFAFLKELDLTQVSLPTSKYTVATQERILSPVFSTFFLLKTKEDEEALRTFIQEQLAKTNHTEDIKKVLRASINVIFNAEEINDIMELNNDMYKKAKKLKQAGHNLVLTANMPTHAYNGFLKLSKADPLHELFEKERSFISGALQLLTPQKKFYKNIVNTLNTSIEQCIVINEKTANMQNACCLGAAIVKFKPADLESFNKKLETALSTEKTVDDE